VQEETKVEFKRRGRNMNDLKAQIQEKEINKVKEMAELGINDEKSNSSGSDSNPSADEMDVSITALIFI
jgi:hypothetical protein